MDATCEACGTPGAPLHAADPLTGRWPHARCATCGLVWVWPLPDLSAANAPYDGAPRARDDLDDDDASAPAGSRRARARIAALRLPPGARLLDVGCGRGDALAAARAAGLDAVGLDLSPDRAAEARARSGAPVHAGPLSTLPPCAPFDVIRLHQVLEHVPSPRALLAEAAARLAAGGRIVLATPSADARAHAVLGAAWRQLGRPGNGHLVLVGPASLRRLAALIGLEVASLRTRGARARSLGLPRGARRAAWRAVESALEPVVRAMGRGSTLEATLVSAPLRSGA